MHCLIEELPRLNLMKISDLLFFEICLVITVAPLGIVCSCSTLRTRRSSALSSYDKWKSAWQASPSSFLGLHLGLELDDHCMKKESTSTKKKCSVNLELICIFLPTYPIHFKLLSAQSMWNFQCSQSFVLSDIWVFWLHWSSKPLWYCDDHCHWNSFWFS